MVLTLVAELLAGETLLSPSGPIDAETAAAGEVSVWSAGAVPPRPEESRAVAEASIVGTAAHPVRR